MATIERLEEKLKKRPDNKRLQRKLQKLKDQQKSALFEPKAASKTEAKTVTPGAPSVGDMSAKDAIAHIKQIDEYPDLEAARTQEEGREKGSRLTVIDALDAAEESFE